MNARAVIRVVSFVLIVLGAAMAGCGLIARGAGDPRSAVVALAGAGGLCVAAGAVAWFFTRGAVELTRRDGFGIVTFGWLATGLAGALPYRFSGVIPSFADAVFESVSGFTTTGASVLQGLEALPRGILFWRSLTHFFGGMGVLVLCVAILPLLGTGGMQLFRAEMPGPSKDRLTPRIATTAKLLWGVYVLLCAAQTLLLKWGGLSWFDALCHSFATVATGGFSTRSDSIAAFHSPFVETVIIVFMFLAGANFALHFRFLTGAFGAHPRDPEFRCYFAVALLASLGVAALILGRPEFATSGAAVRAAVFQVVSILTTTGFSTANFDLWPNAARFLLVALMLMGACAGSTSGGLKQIRVAIATKQLLREIRRAVMPQSVQRVKLAGQPLEDETVSTVVGYTLLVLAALFAGSLAMTFFTPDLETAVTSAAATLGCIGPGLSAVGPASTYAAIPAAGKAVLIVLMLLGRLEMLAIVVLFLPRFWRR